MFDTPDARQGTLENLVAQRALSSYVMDNHLSVSDDTLRKTIAEIGGLKNADGSFDKERYKQLLAAQGLTPEKFEAGRHRDVQLGDRWMDAMGVDYSCLFPTGMLNIGLHCRLVGRPGRSAALARFVDYVLSHDKVWVTRRIDIARHRRATHPYQSATAFEWV